MGLLRFVLVVVFASTLHVASYTALPTDAVPATDERSVRQVDASAALDEERWIRAPQWWSKFLYQIKPTLKYNRNRISRLNKFIRKAFARAKKKAKGPELTPKVNDGNVKPNAPPDVVPEKAAGPLASPAVESPPASPVSSSHLPNWSPYFASAPRDARTETTAGNAGGWLPMISNWWNPAEKPPTFLPQQLGPREAPHATMGPKPMDEPLASVPTKPDHPTPEQLGGYFSPITNWWYSAEKPRASVAKEGGTDTPPAGWLPMISNWWNAGERPPADAVATTLHHQP